MYQQSRATAVTLPLCKETAGEMIFVTTDVFIVWKTDLDLVHAK